MKKDAYYFSHFCNARHDRKIKRLRKELGIEGYGIYFMILEVLREQLDFRYPLKDVDLLAEEFGTSEAKLNTVLSKYDLFDVDENGFFYSQKFIFYLTPYIEKTERARIAAKARWSNLTKEMDANALPEHSKCNADLYARKGEENKGDEMKEDESKEKALMIELQDEIFKYFDIDKDNRANMPKMSHVVWFVNELQKKEILNYFNVTFSEYKEYIEKTGSFRFGFTGFLGDFGGDICTGGWNKETWGKKLEQHLATKQPNNHPQKHKTYIPVSTYGPDYNEEEDKF